MKRERVFSFAFGRLGITALFWWTFAGHTLAQAAPSKPNFWDFGTIQQQGNRVSVKAFYPRPLQQALEAIARHYGWVVDYEDPPYGPADLADDTDPKWRQAHPDEKGVTRWRGADSKRNLPRAPI